MPYSEDKITELAREYEKVCSGLDLLLEKTVLAGAEVNNEGVKEYFLHGVGRRLGVINKTINNVFRLFPLEIERPAERDVIYDVQINIHAHVMNVCGIFDNWAWAFVLEHELLEDVGGKHGVGMFKNGTKQFLPKELAEYVEGKIENWHKEYMKSYRDALAHKIPLYIPPANYEEDEGELYNELEGKKMQLIMSHKWEALEEVEKEQAELGSPSFVFMHSFQEGSVKPILFHPQLLADGNTVVEFGKLFMAHWRECA